MKGIITEELTRSWSALKELYIANSNISVHFRGTDFNGIDFHVSSRILKWINTISRGLMGI